MFVRKGTVRKARGSASRRSTRRPRSDPKANEPGSPRRDIVPDEVSSSSIKRFARNGEYGAAKSASITSFTTEDKIDNGLIASANVSPSELQQITRHAHFKDKYNTTVEPSPARSQATTVVSFDDERRLVRTSVGWDYHPHGDDLQQDYGAFMYQIREANKEADNIVDFGCKTSHIICNTLCVTVLVGMSLVLPVAMVSIGVKYLDDCPKEPRIPVYLLVGGCFGMIKLLSSLWRNIQARRYQDIEIVFDDHDGDDAFASTTYRTMDALLFLFLVGWQIVGSYWTVKIWTPHFEQLLHEPSNWCDRNVYMFSVYQISACYGAMTLYILVLITLTCCVRCR